MAFQHSPGSGTTSHLAQALHLDPAFNGLPSVISDLELHGPAGLSLHNGGP
jgi:hypothetical protein